MAAQNWVSAEWLKDRLHWPNLVIVDCRFQLGQPAKGSADYQLEHIPGAIYLDLEKDLSGPVGQHGGRHPLPPLDDFVQTLSRKGIDASKHVVIYDDQGGLMAARLWWMLKYAGHEQAQILAEGFTHWKEQGYPLTSDVPEPADASFEPNVREDMLVTMEEVKQKLNDPNVLLIDSRSEARYMGEHEDIDPVGGHIPGAVNENWQNRLREDGRWKSKEEQIEDLRSFIRQKDKEMIVYCGSGVSACANIIAFDEAGLRPRLYAGSWSDWISYPDNPVSKGKDVKGKGRS